MVSQAAVLAVTLATMLASALPAFADPDPSTRRPQAMNDVPDFGSATRVPSNSYYEITDDGFLIYGYDSVVKCESLRPGNYTDQDLYEELVEVCTEAGFPPEGTLPETGGPLPLLLPLALLLLGAGLLARTIAPVKPRGREVGSRPGPRSARGRGS
jgi:hypothetical protein